MSTKSKARHERRHPEESAPASGVQVQEHPEEVAGTILTGLLTAITFGALEDDAE